MKDGITKSPQPPLVKQKTGKIGLKDRMERNVIGHAATSPLGMKAESFPSPLFTVTTR